MGASRLPSMSRGVWYGVALALSAFSLAAALSDGSGLAVSFLVLAAITLVSLGRYENMFHMTWLTGHLVFCILPSLICLAMGLSIGFELAALCSGLSVAALALTDRPSPELSVPWTPGPISFVVITALCFAAMAISKGSSFLFTNLTLVLLFSSISQRTRTRLLFMFYFAIVCFIIMYAFVYWSGFGRLILAGTLIIPTLVMFRRLNIPFGKHVFLGMCMLAGVLGTLLRLTDSTLDTVIRRSLADSNVGPFLIGQSLVDRSMEGIRIDWLGWLDQLMLFGLAVWPRDWWTEKPLGFGAIWVVENMGPGYWGHSIASTFMGEHLYYLGVVWGIVAAFAAVFLISTLYNALMGSRRLFGLGGFLVAVYLPTFYWGGIASFASRFWTGVIPLIVVLAVFFLLRHSVSSISHGLRGRSARPVR